MFLRTLIGLAALAAFAWRREDPETSRAVFFNVSDRLSGWLGSSEALSALGQRLVDLVLIEQADGFLLGIAFIALLSIVFWPFRAAAGWVVRRVRNRPEKTLADVELEPGYS